MTKTMLTFATMTAVAFLTSITISTPSFAKMVNDKTAASLLSQCNIADDAVINATSPAGWSQCCSASLGYCVECPPIGSTSKCQKYSNRRMPTLPKVSTPAPGQLAPVGRINKPWTSKNWNKWQKIPQKNQLQLR